MSLFFGASWEPFSVLKAFYQTQNGRLEQRWRLNFTNGSGPRDSSGDDSAVLWIYSIYLTGLCPYSLTVHEIEDLRVFDENSFKTRPILE